MEKKIDDHYFTRMCDVRKEIESNVFPILGDLLKELREAERKWIKEYVASKIDAVVEVVSERISKLDMRIKSLEGEEEKRNGRTEG